ncbi:minichromosome maintenance protein MCM [Halomarina oriensis]|uniref:DNA helicase n=1 Tax=Halomarina oriensis TaxID=671145 RepID=A0A6B0GLS6_9EURY|nr:minichromosome maintenance protein MCM [Halomarina oriensis]MWG34841.1 AAA domain-containing protein [Halomarina oriensis]
MSEAASAELVDDLDEFYRVYYKDAIGELARHYPQEQRSLTVSYRDLERGAEDVAGMVFDQPEKAKELLEEALALYDLPVDVNLRGAHVRITDLPPDAVWDVGMWRPKAVDGRLQGVHGQVTKVSARQELLKEAAFDCQRCGTLTRVPQVGDELQDPHECHGCERQGPFRLNKQQSERVDHQLARLKTPPERSHGMTSEEFDITLTDDLVGEVVAGDRIVANCRIESRPKTSGRTKKPLLELYGEAESIERTTADLGDVNVAEHIERIREIANSPNPVEQIVDSINPSHMGDRLIKEAIAYIMFGGVHKRLPDGSTIRGNSHCLIIGDPGTGKSTHLKYAANLMPRSVTTTGRGSTAAGLTAAAVNDDFGGGGWTLEAGALVKASGGLCAIDELDDMAEEDRAGMLQAMSDQEISINKAGINATLPAETSVFAAANPKHGRFDIHSDLAQQFDLDPALLSRFDLIFTLTDRPDADHDRAVARHQTSANRVGQQLAQNEHATPDDATGVTPAIDEEVMRAFIAHARTLSPVLTDGAMDLIADEYVALRSANPENEAIPVTARMNEGIIRLAEASARIHLREEVTRTDVERVMAIHRRCLEDVGVDPETGELDVDIVEAGTSQSQRQRVKSIRAIISDLEGKHDNGAPIEKVYEIAGDMGTDEDRVDHEIQKLKDQGDVYEPNQGHFRAV